MLWREGVSKTAKAEMELRISLILDVVFCKECKHRNSPEMCPFYKFDATDDYDFCSRGEKR